MQVKEFQDFPAFLEERGISPFEYQRLSRDMQQYFVEAWHIECAIIENGQRLPGQPLRPLQPIEAPIRNKGRDLTWREITCIALSVCFVVSLFALLVAGGPKQRIESSDREPAVSTTVVNKKPATKQTSRHPKRTSDAISVGLNTASRIGRT
jgi:hypothetical protein